MLFDLFTYIHSLLKLAHVCNVQRFFSAIKMKNFIEFFLIVFLFLLKTLIVGTH